VEKMFYAKTLYVGKFNIILIEDLAALQGLTKLVWQHCKDKLSWFGSTARMN
jgi:hypothetical protein